MRLKLVLFYGSVRSDRKGIRLVRYLAGRCRKRGHRVAVIDPALQQLPLLDRMYKEYEPKTSAPEAIQRVADAVMPADAYLVVSGEYNHSPPPALLNVLDHFLEEYLWKPSAIACYSAGAFGGVRAAIALRSTLAEMGMSSIPSVFPVPKISEAFQDDGTPTSDEWDRRSDRFLAELEWYADALRSARERDGKAREGRVPFEDAIAALEAQSSLKHRGP